jgi:hypothetical protein
LATAQNSHAGGNLARSEGANQPSVAIADAKPALQRLGREKLDRSQPDTEKTQGFPQTAME